MQVWGRTCQQHAWTTCCGLVSKEADNPAHLCQLLCMVQMVVGHCVYVCGEPLTICVRLMLLSRLMGVSFCTGSGPMSGCRPTGSMERLWLGVVPKGEAVVPTPLKDGPPRPLLLLVLVPKGLAGGAAAGGGNGGDEAMMCGMRAKCGCVTRAAKVGQHAVQLEHFSSMLLCLVDCAWYARADNKQGPRCFVWHKGWFGKFEVSQEGVLGNWRRYPPALLNGDAAGGVCCCALSPNSVSYLSRMSSLLPSSSFLSLLMSRFTCAAPSLKGSIPPVGTAGRSAVPS